MLVWNAFARWPAKWWDNYYFYVNLVIPALIGIVSTVWFVSCGFIDLRSLFRDLTRRVDNPEDNGQVLDSDKS